MTFLKGTINGIPVILQSKEYKITDFAGHISKAYQYDAFPEEELSEFHAKYVSMMQDYMTIAAINVARSEKRSAHTLNTLAINRIEAEFRMKREELEELMGQLNAVSLAFSVFVKEQGQLLGSAVPRIEEDLKKYIARLKDIHTGIKEDRNYFDVDNRQNGQKFRDLVNPHALINVLVHLYPSYTLDFDKSFADFVMEDSSIVKPA